MHNDLEKLSVVIITYNNDGIFKTLKSIKELSRHGTKVIIQNGGDCIEIGEYNVRLVQESDDGIYDALNKGIKLVETEFFMLIHAGDEFIASPHILSDIITSLRHTGKDLSLNSQLIGSRMHSSKIWQPWMLTFGVQPPHLPTIYRSSIFKTVKYPTSFPVIGDFEYFRRLNWNNFAKHNKLLIKMDNSGLTSSGFRSFFLVNKEFFRHYRIKALPYIFFRLPFKIIQKIIS